MSKMDMLSICRLRPFRHAACAILYYLTCRHLVSVLSIQGHISNQARVSNFQAFPASLTDASVHEGLFPTIHSDMEPGAAGMSCTCRRANVAFLFTGLIRSALLRGSMLGLRSTQFIT